MLRNHKTSQGFRTALQVLALILTLAIGRHLYLYGAGGPLDLNPKAAPIAARVSADVQILTAQGKRLAGTGVLRGMANNFLSWADGYVGCSKQADIVASDLQVVAPGWKFKVVNSPLHHWVVAQDGNGNKLRIDPWTGEVSVLVSEGGTL